MTPDRLDDLAGDPRFIPGVYNYCDRWCERCPLSHRCLNYAMEQAEEDQDPVARDLASQEFWDSLHRRFHEAVETIHEDAERLGIDLDDPEPEAEVESHERELRREAALNQPLSRDARDYARTVHGWFARSESLLKARGVDLEEESGPVIGRPVDEVEEIRSVVEVVRWYEHFIYAKLARAIGSRAEEEQQTDPELRAILNDGDGSAKIALIAMDRSLEAWATLRQRFPEEKDAILQIQLRLDRIRKETESAFPNARAFVRPGFDEGLARLEVGADQPHPSD